MKTVLEILYRPRKTAERLCARPSWLGPFLLLSLASTLLYWLGSERQIQEAVAHLPGAASRAQVVETLRGELWRECLFFPYRLALGWGGFACLLYASGRAITSERGAGLRHVLALEVHAEVILLFPAVLLIAGIPLPSLDLLFRGEGFLIESLLRAANCFTLWYILTLSAGMAVLFELRPRAAFLVVGACWGLSEGLNAGVLALLTRTFHFHL